MPLLGQSTRASPRPQPMASRAGDLDARAHVHSHSHTRARALARSLSCSLPQSPSRSDPRRRSPWRRRPTPAFLGRLVSPWWQWRRRRRCAQVQHKGISMADEAPVRERAGGSSTGEGRENWPRSVTKLNLSFPTSRQKRDKHSAGLGCTVAVFIPLVNGMQPRLPRKLLFHPNRTD